jgi:hypothetical protein
MNRHLMWIVAGTAAVGLAAPADAAVQSGGTREQSRRSGSRRGHDVTSTSSKKGSITSAARGLTGP